MNHQLLQKILDCPRLPSLPAIALDVIQLCRQEDINLRQIARTISNDPALSTKVLRTVNSSYYGLSQPVSTISHALVILGLNSVRTLALGFSLVTSLKDAATEGFDLSQVWRRSLYAAVGARTLAKRLGVMQHEEAFMAALLQDVGMIAMLQSQGGQYIEILKQVGLTDAALVPRERGAFDLDHNQVGRGLAERWKLPPILISPIRYHGRAEDAPPEVRPLVLSVMVGTLAGDVFMADRSRDTVEQFFLAANHGFGVDQATALELLEGIGQGTREMGKLFEINAHSENETQTILADANEVLLQLSLQTQQNASQLEAQNRELKQKAERDALTGIANRGRFNDYLCQQFEHTTRQMQPVSMILIDADRFKSVNDQHGHIVGDEVLTAIARTLAKTAPENVLVARYGGEEFALVLPNVDRKHAAQLAEQLRLAVQAIRIELDSGQNLAVTISLGVATFDGVRFYTAPQQLIKAADQAVYAAKAAGRNCVRVFAPRNPAPVPQHTA